VTFNIFTLQLYIAGSKDGIIVFLK